MKTLQTAALAGVILSFASFECPAENPSTNSCELKGDWLLSVETTSPSGAVVKGEFQIEPVEPTVVKDERCDKLPNFNPNAWGGWQKGYALKAVRAQECSAKGALDPRSLKVADAPGSTSTAYKSGVDFAVDPDWGSVGRLPNGEIEEKGCVFISYNCYPQRIDSIILSADGKSLLLKKGFPDVANPKPPALEKGETRVANILLAGRMAKLRQESLFPILETSFPAELAAKDAGVAEKLLPKTMKKLREGGKLKILAWGDSVTECVYLPDREKSRWQAQFVARLKEKYPNAEIELVTEAWPGHNTRQYFLEPPGSVHNYQEKVLDVKPDLIISEFVNDAGMKGSEVPERYGKMLSDFKAAGVEWIVIAPHYIRPDWMGLSSQKNIDKDPREYVKALREFADANGIPFADASARYGRLWRQGVPYATLMTNAINHPDQRGLAIFADALANLFP